MFYAYIPPSPLLAPYIRYYWILEIGAAEGSVTERVIPTGEPQILFHYRTPFVRKLDGRAESQPRSFLSGMSGEYADISSTGDSGVVAVTFHPYGASAFFPFPQSEVEDRNVGLGDAGWAGAGEIEEELAEARSIAGRIAVIERHLTARLRPPRQPDFNLVRAGVSLIRRQNGSIRTADLSSALCCTPKTLERPFSAYLGKTPKQFGRIVRFQEAVRSLQKPGFSTLTDFSYRIGYYDQSHFINDFREMSGCTPGEFLAAYPCASPEPETILAG